MFQNYKVQENYLEFKIFFVILKLELVIKEFIMTFKEWAYSSYPNPSIDGQWGLLHITTLIASIVIIMTLSILFRNKDEKQRKIVL